MTRLIQEFNQKITGQSRQMGGAAIEYILISIFGILLSIAAIAFVSQAVKERLSTIEEKLGIELDVDELNPF